MLLLAQDLVSPCLRPRHWHALSRAVHTKNSLYRGYNKLVQMKLKEIMKLNLHEHITIVRQVRMDPVLAGLHYLV